MLESLLKKSPKNAAEIEFEENDKNYKITKVDDPDTDDEKDYGDSGDDVSVGVETCEVATAPKKEEYAELPNNITVIDLISDDEEEEGEVSEAGNTATTTTRPLNKRPREDEYH